MCPGFQEGPSASDSILERDGGRPTFERTQQNVVKCGKAPEEGSTEPRGED